MCTLWTVLQCDKVACLGDGAEVKIRSISCSPRANCHAELQAHLLRLLLAVLDPCMCQLGCWHVMCLQHRTLFSCVSGCCRDQGCEKGAAVLQL